MWVRDRKTVTRGCRWRWTYPSGDGAKPVVCLELEHGPATEVGDGQVEHGQSDHVVRRLEVWDTWQARKCGRDGTISADRMKDRERRIDGSGVSLYVESRRRLGDSLGDRRFSLGVTIWNMLELVDRKRENTLATLGIASSSRGLKLE